MTTLTELAERVESGETTDDLQVELAHALKPTRTEDLEAIECALNGSRDAADAMRPPLWVFSLSLTGANNLFYVSMSALKHPATVHAEAKTEAHARLAANLRAWAVEKGQDDG